MKIKTFLFLCLLTFTVSSTVFAQSRPRVNHNALYVKNLANSTAFYKDVMQLELIPEPFHDGKHAWFRTGEHSQLHIIQGAAEIVPKDVNTHYAYSVPDLAVFIKHLDELHIKYGNGTANSKITLRADGVKQIYLQDPDNFWIEVNDDKF